MPIGYITHTGTIQLRSMANSTLQADALLDTLYDLTLDPSLFEQFTHAWDQFLQQDLCSEDSHVDEAMQQHFERAFLIIEKMGRVIGDEKSLGQLVQEREDPCIGINKTGTILSANFSARQLFGDSLSQTSLWDTIHEKSAQSLQNGIEEIFDSGGFVPILVLLENNIPSLFVLRKVADIDQILVDISGSVWTDRVSEFLQQTHQLTLAEIGVAKLLYRGLNVSQIADSKSRSKETIRKHLAALLSKTDCHSQSQLMRLITSINFAKQQTGHPKWFSKQCTVYKHRLGDDRELSYYDTGGGKSKVLVVTHPFLRTPELPTAMQNRICANGYRIIGVCRAGYGDSSLASADRNAIQGAAKDMRELLGSLSIDKVTLLGLMGGAIHCYQTASMYPNMIESIINVEGTVPIIDDQQIKNMPPSTRAIAFTARKFPKLFPLLARTGVALIDSGDSQKIINSLYGKSESDLLAAGKDEVKQWIVRGCEFAVHQGATTWANEMSQVAGLTYDFLREVNCPVNLIHSEQDAFVSYDSVQELSAKFENFSLTTIADSCHLALYDRPRPIAEEIINCLGFKKPSS